MVLKRVRAVFWHTALGPAVVVWGFAYVLIDIVAFLLENSALGLNLLASLPLFALGVALTMALDTLRDAARPFRAALRWSLFLLAVAAATCVHSLFDLYWLRWVSIAIFPEWQEWALPVTRQRFLTAAIVYLWTFTLALTVLWGVRIRGDAEASAARAASAEAAAARAEASLHRAEAAALRLQLNPHFLFNSLNSISSLVLLDRKEEAEEMIERLCDFLRASLNADPMADVPLAQEIDSIDAYLGVEAVRFGERLDIDIDVEPGTSNSQVPNFILQPLVENAIKHGVASVRGRANLSIEAARDGDALVLKVENSSCVSEPAPRDANIKRRAGIGLLNIRQRLATCYGDRARLETGPTPGGFRAVIRLPFVEAAR